MKIYTTQAAVEKDIVNGVLAIEGDVKFECSININASIKVITGNINAKDITAWDINTRDITAWDINTRDINATDINVRDINAEDIIAGNINARNINARDISYFAFCCVYGSIKCVSIKARREKYQEPICLDGEIEYKAKEPSLSGKKVKVELDGKTYSATID